MNTFDKLNEYLKKVELYRYTVSMLRWEMDTIAPKKSFNYLIEASASLELESFKLTTSDKYINLIEEVIKSEEYDNLNELQKNYINALKKDYYEMKNVPEDFYEEYCTLCNKSLNSWVEAKDKNDYQIFKPYLKEIIEKTKMLYRYRYPECKNLYDCMLNDYETGIISGLSGSDLEADYEHDMYAAPIRVPRIKTIVTDITVTARPRKLATAFSLDAAYDLQMTQNVDLQSIIAGAATDEIRSEIDGEILNDVDGGRDLSLYTKYMKVTDNGYIGSGVFNAAALRNKDASLAVNAEYGKKPSNKIVTWVESHDTFTTDGYKYLGLDETRLARMWAIVASRKDTNSLFFARTDAAFSVAKVSSYEFERGQYHTVRVL